MGRYIIALCILFAAGFCACDDDDKLPNVEPSASGTYTDERDGRVYGWIRIGDQEWMTENLKFGTPYYEREYGGVFADNYGNPAYVTHDDISFDFEADLEENGNLYDWYEADTLCPEGWRLPSDDDWKKLEMALGMSENEANQLDWRGEGVADLLRQDEEGLGLNLPLSGMAWKRETWALYVYEVGDFGWYWTSTEDESGDADVPVVYFRKIFATYNTVCRRVRTIDALMRVRCVRDAQE